MCKNRPGVDKTVDELHKACLPVPTGVARRLQRGTVHPKAPRRLSFLIFLNCPLKISKPQKYYSLRKRCQCP